MSPKTLLDEYVVLAELAPSPKRNVKLVQQKGEVRSFAAKMVKCDGREDRDAFIKEVELLRSVTHPNIIQFVRFVNSAMLREPSGIQRVSYAVLEFAEKGEVFELLVRGKRLSHDAAKLLFRQLLSALAYLHGRNIAHRDLKLENMLLDANLDLKLIDFGFATRRLLGGTSDTYLGSPGYLAPEALAQRPYDVYKADVFAAGVVLFSLIAGHPPFLEAQPADTLFKAFASGSSKFWSFHQKRAGDVFTPAVRTLLEGMMASDSQQRLSVEEVRKSEWVIEPIDTSKAMAELRRLTVRHDTTSRQY